MVEEDGSNVVEMAIEREETAPGLIRPDLDLVVIAARHEQRLDIKSVPASTLFSTAMHWTHLSLVEIDAAHRAIVFFESVDQGAHSVIPELDRGRVKRNEDPWSRARKHQSPQGGGEEG